MTGRNGSFGKHIFTKVSDGVGDSSLAYVAGSVEALEDLAIGDMFI